MIGGGPKGIYGDTDRRYNLYELMSSHLPTEVIEKIKLQAQSIVILTSERHLEPTKDKKFALKTGRLLTLADYVQREIYKQKKQQYLLGENEKFREEKVCVGDMTGTGFLIARQFILTAAHVICREKTTEINHAAIRSTVAIFGYFKETYDKSTWIFPAENVYKITLVKHYYCTVEKEDWALLRLDRPTDRLPLSLDLFPPQATKHEVYMIGHPLGLPLKVTVEAEIKKHTITRSDGVRVFCNEFESDLDAFNGNSGAPICSLSGLVEGFLRFGNPDWDITDNYEGRGVSRSYAYHPDPVEEGYEKCHKITTSLFTAINRLSLDNNPVYQLLEKIRQENLLSIKWLAICSFLYPTGIPIAWLHDWLIREGALSGEAQNKVGCIVNILKRENLIYYDDRRQSISISLRLHEIFHDQSLPYRRFLLNPLSISDYLKIALDLIICSVPSSAEDRASVKRWLKHARSVKAYIPNSGEHSHLMLSKVMNPILERIGGSIKFKTSTVELETKLLRERTKEKKEEIEEKELATWPSHADSVEGQVKSFAIHVQPAQNNSPKTDSSADAQLKTNAVKLLKRAIRDRNRTVSERETERSWRQLRSSSVDVQRPYEAKIIAPLERERSLIPSSELDDNLEQIKGLLNLLKENTNIKHHWLSVAGLFFKRGELLNQLASYGEALHAFIKSINIIQKLFSYKPLHELVSSLDFNQISLCFKQLGYRDMALLAEEAAGDLTFLQNQSSNTRSMSMVAAIKRFEGFIFRFVDIVTLENTITSYDKEIDSLILDFATKKYEKYMSGITRSARIETKKAYFRRLIGERESALIDLKFRIQKAREETAKKIQELEVTRKERERIINELMARAREELAEKKEANSPFCLVQ